MDVVNHIKYSMNIILLSYFYACVKMLSFLSLYIADRSPIDLIDVLKFNGNQGDCYRENF